MRPPRWCMPVVLLGLVSSSTALGSTTGKIAGEVRDRANGEPVIGANVIIDGTTMGASANIEGYYVILNVPPGVYSVSVSALGYSKTTITGVRVSIDLTTHLNVDLESSVIEGEEVIVTAERPLIRKDLTSSQARVDASEIEKIAVREVREVIALQAGVTTGRFGGIHIRGGRTSEVGYWVDGISVSDVYDGEQAVQVSNTSVQELQVISGTFNAEFGQAMSGIVNIVTKDGGQDFRGTVSSYLGDYVTSDPTYYNISNLRPLNTRNVEMSLSGPVGSGSGLTFYVSGRYFKTDGWLFGNRTFHPNGDLAPGASYILDADSNIIGVRRPDNPVPMNNSERLYGQFKLTYQLAGNMKLSLSGLGSRNDFRDYSHDWALNPGGDVRKFDRGYSGSLLFTHTVDGTSFYTVNASFFQKKFREYLYEDPLDPRYILDPAAFNRNISEFFRSGTNLHQFKRTTESRVAKVDYVNQVSRLHQVKVGAEGRLHRLYLEDYGVTPLQDTVRINGVLTDIYRPSIPERTGPLYREYTERPIEFSAYVQDKLEYERMIVNVGVRFDYFHSRGKVLADPQDPNVYLPQKIENKALSLVQRLATWYKDATAKHYISPRLGISYPITDRGVLHFSYGHFLQIPSFSFLYQNPGYKVNSVEPLQGVFGNADLEPQKTVMYEFGLQQQLSDVLSFDITGFYRDTRDWVGTSAKIPVRDPSGLTATTFYTIFVNKDYANSRGVTLTVSKRPSDLWTMSLAYTFQTAEGSNSSPDEEQAALAGNREPSKTLSPLDWDQTHTLNANIGIGESDWGFFVLGRYGSGLPYTPVLNQAEGRGEDAARVITRNSRRRPGTLSFDVRAFKNFNFSVFEVSVFVKVFNIFDRRNEVGVFGETGRASATPRQLGLSGLGGIDRINTVEEFIIRPDFYSEPREIQFGIELRL